jgi:dolichol kinase
MLEIIATVFLWATILLATELLWRLKLLRGENARKTVHIIISISIALTPYYLSWQQIQLLGGIGVFGAVVVRFSGLFRGAYDIARKSWGDIIGPIAILVVAFLEPHPAIFLAIMMHTGVADGIAAIVGTRYGKANSYKILGYTKSIAGTAAFFVTSLVATMGIILFADVGSLNSLWPLLVLLPVGTTFIENIGVYGIDNALVTAVTFIVCSQFI